MRRKSFVGRSERYVSGVMSRTVSPLVCPEYRGVERSRPDLRLGPLDGCQGVPHTCAGSVLTLVLTDRRGLDWGYPDTGRGRTTPDSGTTHREECLRDYSCPSSSGEVPAPSACCRRWRRCTGRTCRHRRRCRHSGRRAGAGCGSRCGASDSCTLNCTRITPVACAVDADSRA